jgi:hypothetical protein
VVSVHHKDGATFYANRPFPVALLHETATSARDVVTSKWQHDMNF